jgi:hypothetical protein
VDHEQRDVGTGQNPQPDQLGLASLIRTPFCSKGV